MVTYSVTEKGIYGIGGEDPGLAFVLDTLYSLGTFSRSTGVSILTETLGILDQQAEELLSYLLRRGYISESNFPNRSAKRPTPGITGWYTVE